MATGGRKRTAPRRSARASAPRRSARDRPGSRDRDSSRRARPVPRRGAHHRPARPPEHRPGARSRIAAQAHEQARIVAAIVEHVTRAGAWAGTGVLEARWSRLWDTLAAELRLPEPVVRAAIARSCELALDDASDTIRLAPPPRVDG